MGGLDACDLNLCAELNRLGASYVVIGGFAIRAAGYSRHASDLETRH